MAGISQQLAVVATKYQLLKLVLNMQVQVIQ